MPRRSNNKLPLLQPEAAAASATTAAAAATAALVTATSEAVGTTTGKPRRRLEYHVSMATYQARPRNSCSFAVKIRTEAINQNTGITEKVRERER